MSTVAQSPCSEKPNPVWADQVKVGRGRNDMGAFHRAVAVAVKLFETGQWNGFGLLVVHDPYQTYNKMESYREPLVAGVDFEYADDTVYRISGPAGGEGWDGLVNIAPAGSGM